MAGASEVPPQDYQPSHFVSEDGCVFTRAYIGGWTLWVESLDQARQPFCEREPTRIVPKALVPENLPDGET